VNEIVNQQVGLVEADLQMLRDENVVLESERDPELRRVGGRWKGLGAWLKMFHECVSFYINSKSLSSHFNLAKSHRGGVFMGKQCLTNGAINAWGNNQRQSAYETCSQ